MFLKNKAKTETWILQTIKALIHRLVIQLEILKLNQVTRVLYKILLCLCFTLKILSICKLQIFRGIRTNKTQKLENSIQKRKFKKSKLLKTIVHLLI